MKIVVCGSVSFKEEVLNFRDKLNKMGHEAILNPYIEELVLERNTELLKKIKESHAQVKKEGNVIKWYYNAIVNSDAILVVNLDKGDVENYIGGNTLIEMAFAHVHDKKIFLVNPVPEIKYKDEILAMSPIILNGDLSTIQKYIEK